MDSRSDQNMKVSYPDNAALKPRGRFISTFRPVPPTDPSYIMPITSSSGGGNNGHESNNNMRVTDHQVILPWRSFQFYDYGDFDIPFRVPGQQLNFFSPNQMALDLALRSQEAPSTMQKPLNSVDAQQELTRELEIFEDTLNRVRLANASNDQSINSPQPVDPVDNILEEFQDDIENEKGTKDISKILEVACDIAPKYIREPTEIKCQPVKPNCASETETGMLPTTTVKRSSIFTTPAATKTLSVKFARNSTSSTSTGTVPVNICEPVDTTEQPSVPTSEPKTVTNTPTTTAAQPPVRPTTPAVTQFIHTFFKFGPSDTITVPSTDPLGDVTIEPAELTKIQTVSNGPTSKTPKKPATSGITQFVHAVYQCGPLGTVLVPLTDQVIMSDSSEVTTQPIEMNKQETASTTQTVQAQTPTVTAQTRTVPSPTPATTVTKTPLIPTTTLTTTFYDINSKPGIMPTTPIQVTNINRDGTVIKRFVLHPPTNLLLMSVNSVTKFLPLIKNARSEIPRSNLEKSEANFTVLVDKQPPLESSRQHASCKSCKTIKTNCKRKSPPIPSIKKFKFHHYDGPVIPKKRKSKKVAAGKATPPPQNKTVKLATYSLEQQEQHLKWQLELQHKFPRILLPARPKVKTVVVPTSAHPPSPPTISRTIIIGNNKRTLSFEVAKGNGEKQNKLNCSHKQMRQKLNKILLQMMVQREI